MIIIGILLGFVGLAYLCWLLFALAVHALPLFAAVAVASLDTTYLPPTEKPNTPVTKTRK